MLFASLPLDAKVTPEQVLDQRARIAKPPWPMWSYGKRGDMIRDLHWPVRNAEGKLVSKEAAGNASGYVHAHLLHAYVGNSQDVVPEQIECRNYRRRYAPSPARRARWAHLGSEWSTAAHLCCCCCAQEPDLYARERRTDANSYAKASSLRTRRFPTRAALLFTKAKERAKAKGSGRGSALNARASRLPLAS